MLNQQEKQLIQWIDDHRDEIVEFWRDLIRIPSLTGEEGEGQKFVEKKMREIGLDVDVWEPDVKELFEKFPDIAQYPTRWEPEYDFVLRFPEICTYEQYMESGAHEFLNYKDRPNVVGTMKGSGGGRSLILNAHIDTVNLGDESKWEHDPFGAEMVGDRVYGRGAADMKIGLASIVYVAQALKAVGAELRGDLIVQSVVNEEHSGNGTLACLARGYTADAAIIPDCIGSRRIGKSSSGNISFTVTVEGYQTHTGQRWQNGRLVGVSAIDKLPRVIRAILGVEEEANKDGFRMNLGLGTIQGGTYATATADKCTIMGVIYFGAAMGAGVENVARIRNLLIDAVKHSADGDEWLEAHPPKVEILHYDDAYDYRFEDTGIIDALVESGREFGLEIPVLDMGAACDVRHLGNSGGIPAVVYGPGNIDAAHRVNEWASIEDLILGTKNIALTALRWCK